jgi:hypothetical protein
MLLILMSELHTMNTYDIKSILESPQWENIDRVVYIAFKSIFDLLVSQSLEIDKQGKNINYVSQAHQTSVKELNSALDLKASCMDLQELLDQKVSKTDINYLLSNKTTIQDLKSLERKCIQETNRIYEDILKRWEDTLSKVELEDIYKLLDTKANRLEIEEVLQTKANKQAVANALHKKINRGELENSIASKADMKEIQPILAALEAKVEYSSFENLKKHINEKFAELDDLKISIDLLLPKNDFNAFRDDVEKYESLFSKLDHLKQHTDKSLEKTEIKLNELITINTLQSQEKFNNETASTKALIKQKTDNLESELSKVLKTFEKFSKATENDLKATKDTILSMQSSIKELSKEAKKAVSANSCFLSDISAAQEELQKLQKAIEDLSKKKMTIAQAQEINNLLRQESLLDTRQEIHQALASFKTASNEDIASIKDQIKQFLVKQDQTNTFLLDKKANGSELSNLNNEIQNLKKNLNFYCKQDEIDLIRDNLETIQVNLRKKNEFDALERKKLAESIEYLYKGLATKVETGDLDEILESKANIDEVNKSIGELHLNIEKKANLNDFEMHLRDQNVINEALCAENRIGRWIWKSGDIRSGNIVWDIQQVNTSEDIYIWDKGKTTIQVLHPGLYQIEFGFFSKRKPNISVIVNGETVITGGNSMSSKLWGKQNISGISLTDFLVLPNRSRVCISYSGEPAEGFFGIKKL